MKLETLKICLPSRLPNIFFLLFKIVVDAGVEAASALPEVAQALAEYAQIKGQYKKQTTPSKAAARNKRSPVFFKFVRVDYDKENGRLKLSEGEFAGRAVSADSRSFEEDKAEYEETIVGMEKEGSDFLGKIINQA